MICLILFKINIMKITIIIKNNSNQIILQKILIIRNVCMIIKIIIRELILHSIKILFVKITLYQNNKNKDQIQIMNSLILNLKKIQQMNLLKQILSKK